MDNFLQRPGGNGPKVALQPLGGLASVPAAGPAAYNSAPEGASPARALALDNVNRVLAQYKVDMGEFSRLPVGPTNYEIGNIMPSQEPTGPAGYNHQGKMVFPGRAADLNKAEFIQQEMNTMNPALRADMQRMTQFPQQNFYNLQNPTNYMPVNYNMPDSLYMQAPMMMEKRGE